MSILFITAYRDIGRNNWKSISRTNQTYLENFFNLINNINNTYNIIVYVEDNIKNEIYKFHNLPSNIIIKNINYVDDFYTKYQTIEEQIIVSDAYKQLIPIDRKEAPEHWCSKYNLVNHSKINYVSHSKKIYPDYDYYSWIDFGCIRNTVNDVPKNIDFNKLNKMNQINKIIFLINTHIPINKINDKEMLSSHTIYFMGSQFIIHRDYVEIYEQLYENKLKYWHDIGIVDDDQNLILQIYYDNPELFNLIFEKEWFSLFRKHLNV